MFKKISLAVAALALVLGGFSQAGVQTSDIKDAYNYVCCDHDGAGLSN